MNDEFLDERSKLKSIIDKSKEYEGKALIKNKKELYISLDKIKNVGEKAALTIEEKQPFKNFADFSFTYLWTLYCSNEDFL